MPRNDSRDKRAATEAFVSKCVASIVAAAKADPDFFEDFDASIDDFVMDNIHDAGGDLTNDQMMLILDELEVEPKDLQYYYDDSLAVCLYIAVIAKLTDPVIDRVKQELDAEDDVSHHEQVLGSRRRARSDDPTDPANALIEVAYLIRGDDWKRYIVRERDYDKFIDKILDKDSKADVRTRPADPGSKPGRIRTL